MTARTRANRINALRSTGPRTPAGLARSSQNAIKAGLFSKVLVLPALGETAEDLDRFRTQVVADLAAVGVVECELADRVAGLLWRLRRVARSEAATLAVPPATLPPHPDEVTPFDGTASTPFVPPGAPTAHRLAHLRGQLSFAPGAIAAGSAAAGAFARGTDPKAPLGALAGWRVLGATAAELGWTQYPWPWAPVLAAAGFHNTDVNKVTWTAARCRRLLRFAADGAGRAHSEFLKAIRDRLRDEVTEIERLTAARRRQEADLVAALHEERAAAFAAQVCADEGLIQRVARAEGHLSRELDRTLALLARLQGERRVEPVCGSAPGRNGFVLPNAVPGSGVADSMTSAPTLERA